MTYGDPPLKKPSEPPMPILEPLPCELEYTFLGDIEDIILYEEINPLVFKPNIYHEESDPRTFTFLMSV